MCGGFYCSRNTLILLNLMYIVTGSVGLIGFSVYGNRFTDLPILPSVIASGIVLLFLSCLGIYGAVKHNQVSLFFYMIILFCLFIVQFAIACSCLAVNKQQQDVFAEHAWDSLSDEGKKEVQDTYTCCGFNSNSTSTDDHPACDGVLKICCPKGGDDCSCPACLPKLKSTIDSTFKICGQIGLFLSFTEILSIIVARRYRNQHDPFDLPSRAYFPSVNFQHL